MGAQSAVFWIVLNHSHRFACPFKDIQGVVNILFAMSCCHVGPQATGHMGHRWGHHWQDKDAFILRQPGHLHRFFILAAYDGYDGRLIKIDKIKGLNITIVTTAKSDEEGKALLKMMGMPFRN